MVGGDQDLALLVPEDSVRGAVTRAVDCLQGTVAKLQDLTVLKRVGDGHVRAPAAEAARDAAQRHGHLLGDAVAQHQLDREAILRLRVLVEVG